MIGREAAAATTALLALPFRWLVPDEHLDRSAPHVPPVVFVHGLLGHPTNFVVLRRALAGRPFASFAYAPRLDYPRLAAALGHLIEGVCATTGAPQVDVVGHSLGGLVARYLVETDGSRVRRLVTLGAPYYTGRFPRNELAIFGSHDPFVIAPDPHRGPHGQVRVAHECGHLGLLYHPTVLGTVAAFLGAPAVTATIVEREAA